jgi:hypothetical protein
MYCFGVVKVTVFARAMRKGEHSNNQLCVEVLRKALSLFRGRLSLGDRRVFFDPLAKPPLDIVTLFSIPVEWCWPLQVYPRGCQEPHERACLALGWLLSPVISSYTLAIWSMKCQDSSSRLVFGRMLYGNCL